MVATTFQVLLRKKRGLYYKAVQPDIKEDLMLRVPGILVNRNLSSVLPRDFFPGIAGLVKDYLKMPEDPIQYDNDAKKAQFHSKNALKPFLNEALQEAIDDRQIKNIIATNKSEWSVKENRGDYSWLPLDAKIKKDRCNLRPFLVKGTGILYFVSLIVDEILDYDLDVVNGIPRKVAIAAIATDILTGVPQYFASNLDENVDAALIWIWGCINRCSPTVKPRYNLSEDFELPLPAGIRVKVFAILFAAAQLFSNVVSFASSDNNNMVQYNEAIDEGLITWASRSNFLILAQAAYIVDQLFAFFQPISTAVSQVDAMKRFFCSFCTCCSCRQDDAVVEAADDDLDSDDEYEEDQKTLGADEEAVIPAQQPSHIVDVPGDLRPRAPHVSAAAVDPSGGAGAVYQSAAGLPSNTGMFSMAGESASRPLLEAHDMEPNSGRPSASRCPSLSSGCVIA